VAVCTVEERMQALGFIIALPPQTEHVGTIGAVGTLVASYPNK